MDCYDKMMEAKKEKLRGRFNFRGLRKLLRTEPLQEGDWVKVMLLNKTAKQDAEWMASGWCVENHIAIACIRAVEVDIEYGAVIYFHSHPDEKNHHDRVFCMFLSSKDELISAAARERNRD